GLANTQLQLTQQQNQQEQARRNWRPSVDFQGSYLFAQGGRLIQFPIGDLFNPVYGALNQITQSSDFPTDLENENIQLTPNNFLDLQLQVQQPIFNSAIRYNQAIQDEILRLREIDQDIAKRELNYQVKTAYYDYLKTFEGLRILAASDELLQDVLRVNQRLVQYDKATAEVVADTEYQIAQLASQKAQLETQQTLAKALFNLLLQKDLSADITVDSSILATIDLTDVSLTERYDQALGNYLELRQVDQAYAINSLNRERIQASARPTLGAFGGVGYQTENFQTDIGGPLFTLGVSMQVNLFDGGKRKLQVEALQMEQEMLGNNRRQLEQQLEIGLLQQQQQLRQLRQQMTAETTQVEAAATSLRLTRSRYENNKVILLQLLEAENRYQTSQLQQLLTKYDYLKVLAELDRLTGTE
ncbi:MAG: TolC family protein, partial [Bacteroidota bacterium]